MCLAGKAQKRRNMPIFQDFATQPDKIQRRSKCKVIYLQALSKDENQYFNNNAGSLYTELGYPL